MIMYIASRKRVRRINQTLGHCHAMLTNLEIPTTVWHTVYVITKQKYDMVMIQDLLVYHPNVHFVIEQMTTL